MKKTKGKVLSLILASALIVSSFSTSLVSAASTRENGSLDVENDKIYLVSSDRNKNIKADIEQFIGTVDVETYDHEDANSEEFSGYTHASGDRLVNIDSEGKLSVRSGASGKEVITVNYKASYDRDDKEVTVRASKDITVYVDKEGKNFLGKVVDLTEGNNASKRPDAFGSAAVNEENLLIGVYTAKPQSEAELGTDPSEADKAAIIKAQYEKSALTDAQAAIELKAGEKSKVFTEAEIELANGVITIPTKYLPEDAAVTNPQVAKVVAVQDALADLTADFEALDTEDPTKFADLLTDIGDLDSADLSTAKDGVSGTVEGETTTALTAVGLVITKLDALQEAAAADPAPADFAAIETAYDAVKDALSDADTKLAAAKTAEEALNEAGSAEKLATTGSDTLKIKLQNDSVNDDDKVVDFKIEVAKKIKADAGAEINKKSGTTYLTKSGVSWDDDWTTSEAKADCYSVTGYDVVAAGELTVTNGSVGNITGDNGAVTIKGGKVDDVNVATVSVEDGTVGTIKDKATKIDVTKGKVAAIDAKKAEVTVNGGTVSGKVVGKTVTIDSVDEDVPTTIGGDVTAKGDTGIDPTVQISSGSDAAVKIDGTVKGIVTVSDKYVTIKAIDADYGYAVTFEDFSGKLTTLKNTNNSLIDVKGASKVAVTGKILADEIAIEEDSKVTLDEARVSTVSGDGTLAIPADKLFIEDSLTDVTLQITTGLVAGATAFEAYADTVDPDDFTALGFSVEQKSVNDDVDKFVIKSVTFAGLAFDKTEISVAKGYEEQITLSNYPDGTALPEGAQIEWAIEGDDNYITLTVTGNVGTVKVLDYNADYATDNQATITATVVDEDGYELEDYVVATAEVTGTALPASTLTLDTKTASVGVGGLYQFLAKSSSGAVITAVSSDEQIATVTPYDLLDPRGAKFSVNGVKEGKATITATDANGATASFEVTVVKVEGTLKADTTSYKFAPGNIYDVKFTVTGTTAVPVVTANGKVVSVVSRGNGVYRVTALNPGTAWVQATVGTARVSVTFVVENGATAGGVRGNNVSNL